VNRGVTSGVRLTFLARTVPADETYQLGLDIGTAGYLDPDAEPATLQPGGSSPESDTAEIILRRFLNYPGVA